METVSRKETYALVVGLLLLWGGVVLFKYFDAPVNLLGPVLIAIGSVLLLLRVRKEAVASPAPSAELKDEVEKKSESKPSESPEAQPARRSTPAIVADRSAHDLLEHVPFVALSVGPDLKVGFGGASRHAERLLGKGESLVGEDFVSLVVPSDEDTKNVLRDWLQLIFEKPDQDWDTLLELCPLDSIDLAGGDGFSGGEFRLRYHPMRAGKGGPIVRVLVVGTDVTEERALARELQDRDKSNEASVKKFAEVLKLGAETFRRFLNESQTRLAEASGAIERLEENPEDSEALRALLRQIHTLKANAKALRLEWIAEAATETEDLLAQLRDAEKPGEHPALGDALDHLESLRITLDDTEVLGTTVFGRSLDPGEVRARERDLEVPVRVGRMETIIAMVRAAKTVAAAKVPPAAELLTKAETSLDGLRNVPARNLFQRFPKMVADLAAVMGKRINPLRVTGSDTMLNVRTLDRVGDALVHLLRNAVAHGIESTDLRGGTDKPPQGNIELSLTHEGDRFIFEVIDDGAGVNFDAVKKAAVSANLVVEDEVADLSGEQLQKFIFRPGFSTAPATSDAAGRGVGLDMVEAAAEFLGGEVRFESKDGLGTTISLVVPDRWPC